jgi:DNA polymerase I-like protein with 3'-5' exonuclease and polymerase domains
MRTLVFDTEHRESVFKPWDPDFVLSCLTYTIGDKHYEKDRMGTLWFDHKNISVETPAPIDSWKEFQSSVNEADLIVGHNLKHDLIVAKYCGGINFEGKKLWCTQVADYLIHGQDHTLSYNLDEVAARRGLGAKLGSAKEYWDAGVHTEDIPFDVLDEYATQDVNLTEEVYRSQWKEVDGLQILKVIELQNEFLFSLVDMEMMGLKIDVEKAREIYEQSRSKVVLLEKELKEIFGDERINLESNDQLSACLYGGTCDISWEEWVTRSYKSKPETKYYEKTFKKEVNFPRLFEPLPRTEYKKKGFFKTDKTTISLLKAKTKEAKEIKIKLLELADHVAIMKTLVGKKEDTGILNKIASDGCVHTTFNNTFTTTGRLSSSGPNVMNLYEVTKDIVVPHHDGLLQWDLSQIEWRDAAFLSQDQVMIHEINTGVDQHIAACRDLMGLKFESKSDPESYQNRTHAKVFNFRMIYGGSYWGFFLDPKMPPFSKRKWMEIIDAFFEKYHGLRDHNQSLISRVWSQGGKLEIFSGRRFTFHKSEYDKKTGTYVYPENTIKNWPIQGNSGGDILPLACVVLRRALVQRRMRSKLILTVHDSLVFDYVENELQSLIKLCNYVGDNLDTYISNYFGVDWNVKLGGECECGNRYSNLSPV